MNDNLMILVHPGSACGSADFNLGHGEASRSRDFLAESIRRWQGHLVIIDSDLSDEIPQYETLGKAIKDSIAAATSHGRHVSRLLACDTSQDYNGADWVDQVAAHLSTLEYSKAHITGAWYHPDDNGGCVNAVYDRLHEMGLTVDIGDSAISIDPEWQEPEEN